MPDFIMSSMGHVVGEKITEGGGACHKGTASCYHICLFRRRQNAGGNRVPDADGEDLCGIKSAITTRDSCLSVYLLILRQAA